MDIETLAKQHGGRRLSDDSWSCQCPCHDDKHHSLHLTEADDKLLIYCHAGCEYWDIIKALGIDADKSEPNRPRVEKIYPYQDASGVKRYEVLRYRNPDASKDFRARQSAQVWNLHGVDPLPYRLPEVLRAIERKDMIMWVEGEKDADTLAALGYAATTNHGGANKPKIIEKVSHWFKGAGVWVFPDNDPSGIGQKHAEYVCDSLKNAGATVHLCHVPDDFKDITDYLLTFDSPDRQQAETYELIEHAILWGEPAPIPAPDLLGDADLIPRSYLPMPFREIAKLGGFCEILEKTKMTAVIGPSGGQKTTFIECIVMAWLQAGYSGAMFGPEWSGADMLRRWIQRLGGPSYVKIGKHLAYQADVMTLPENEREFARRKAFVEGKYPLSAADAETVNDLKREIQSWPGNLYVLRPSATFGETVTQFEAALASSKERGNPLDFIVVDYIQIAGNDYEEIMTAIAWAKGFCMTESLHGLVSSQMVKADSRANRQGQAVGSEAMAYASDAAFNSAYVLNRPVDADNHYTNHIKVRVTKNSMGVSGVETILSYDPSRLLITDPAPIAVNNYEPKSEELETWLDR